MLDIERNSGHRQASRRQLAYARRNGKGSDIDVTRVRDALQLVEQGRLTDAASALGPLVRAKRFTRPSRMNPEAEEIDEVKAWLGEVIADPDSADARFLIERSYYKLRTQRPADLTDDDQGSQRSR